MKRLGQQNLFRQVIRIEWTEAAQFFDHFRGDSLRLAILRPAMHYTMSYGGQCHPARGVPRSKPSERPLRPCDRAPSPAARNCPPWFRPFTRKVALRQSDPFNRTLQNPFERVTGLEQRELDARRTAIDRQDAWLSTDFMDDSFVIL